MYLFTVSTWIISLWGFDDARCGASVTAGVFAILSTVYQIINHKVPMKNVRINYNIIHIPTGFVEVGLGGLLALFEPDTCIENKTLFLLWYVHEL